MDESQDMRGRFLRTACWTALFLTPVWVAIACSESVPQGRPVVDVSERASLQFEQYGVNLGEIPAVGTIQPHFDFWNQGDQPLEITRLEASCGCLAPQLLNNRKVYQPGQPGRFVVTVKTANETPGPKEYTVTVHYNDGQPRERLVRFRTIIPEQKVSVLPSEVYFYQLTGIEDTREIRVEDRRGTNLRVLDASIGLDEVEVRIGDRRVDEDGIPWTPIELTVAAKVLPGRRTGWLTIKTDDKKYPQLMVPVLVQGPQIESQPTIELTSGEEEVPVETEGSAPVSDLPKPNIDLPPDLEETARTTDESVSTRQGTILQ